MMRAGDIVVLVGGELRQGVRDADTETSHSFMCELAREWTSVSRLAAVVCSFEDEGVRWARGTIDSPAARALLTVASLRFPELSAVCSACGANLVCIYGDTSWSCPNCGARYP